MIILFVDLNRRSGISIKKIKLPSKGFCIDRDALIYTESHSDLLCDLLRIYE